MAGFTESLDITHNADSVIEIAKFCADRNIEFVYINIPSKICKYDDVSGFIDFANQNADRLLKRLKESEVNYCDLQKLLHDEGINHHEAFFRTDHHWKPETGLWAARKILEFLRNNYNWNTNPDVLNPENFKSVIYHNWFLGSQGKKVSLMRSEPEDISLLYPKCKTLFHYEIPDKGINTTGDFSITYNMQSIESKDYYSKNPYAAYNHADRALIKIKNILTGCDKKLLIVHNSFFNCVIPFLAMDIREIDAIDMRHFNGSLRSYINITRPDFVIVQKLDTFQHKN